MYCELDLSACDDNDINGIGFTCDGMGTQTFKDQIFLLNSAFNICKSLFYY